MELGFPDFLWVSESGGIYHPAASVCHHCGRNRSAGLLALAVYSLIRYFQGQAVEGYTTILLVLLVIGSSIMISLGIIGFYIGKIYDEVRRRPRYLISRMTQSSEEETI